MKVRVSPLEKPYVFKALDQKKIDYIKGEFTVWYCEDCDKIYRDKVDEKCVDTITMKEHIFETGATGIQWSNIETGCGGTIKSISLGDFLGENFNYCIERKGKKNLFSSLVDNQLYIQLRAMHEIFGSCCALVIEGYLEDIIMEERRRVYKTINKLSESDKRKRLNNLEARIKQVLSIPAECMQYGISFLQIKDLNRFIDMLKYFDYKCGTTPKIRDKRKKLSDLLPPLVRQLMTTEGVGDKLALAIFQVVKTPEDLIQTLRYTPEDLLAIKGIGDKKLANIKRDWCIL